MSEKERYATVGTWAEIFNQEGHIVAAATIRKRLMAAGVVGERGLDRKNRFRKHGFYSESDARRECSDLMVGLPIADAEGFIHQDGKRYATINLWAKVLDVTEPAIYPRLEKFAPKPLKGRSSNGLFADFYSEEDMRRLLSDSLEELPAADENGVIQIEGQLYATANQWSKRLNISESTIRLALKASTIAFVRARVKGKVFPFYPEKEVRKFFDDKLDIPTTDADGFLEYNGCRYASVQVLVMKYGSHYHAFRKKLESANVPSIRGRGRTGRPIDFYAEADVERLLAAEPTVPEVDESDFITIDGELHATVNTWARHFQLAPITVARILKKNKVKSIDAKEKMGHVCHFYSEFQIRSNVLEPFADVPRAEEDGFIRLEGSRYAVAVTWAREFDISKSLLEYRAKTRRLTVKKFRRQRGQFGKFYEESEIREVCADLIDKKSNDR